MNLQNPLDAFFEIISAQGTVFSSYVRRFGLSMMWVLGTFVFLAFALISIHAVLWTFFLSFLQLDVFISALCVCAIDLFFMLLCIIAAYVTRKPRSADKEALILRNEKLKDFKDSFAWSALLAFGVSPVGKALLAWFFSRLKGKKDK